MANVILQLALSFTRYFGCVLCDCSILTVYLFCAQVIDEIYRVLRFIQSNKTLPRAHEILTELRDISSMAMEHFEEKIIRSLKPPLITPSLPRFSISGTFLSHSCKFIGMLFSFVKSDT